MKIVNSLRLSLLGLAAALCLAAPARAADETASGGHGGEKPPLLSWSFAGPFGHFDPAQLQRGLKVYREVCAACHGLRYVAFRNLAEEGGPMFTPAQVAVIASEYQVTDGPNDAGEMFQRPGRPADRFPSPFPNEQAARAANGGAYPPDLSLIAKARGFERGFPWFVLDAFTQKQELGPDYLHALLTGYVEPPAGTPPGLPGLHYNKYFPGHWIAMPKPISDGQVEYTDGTPATVDQYATDLGAFFMWTAEPHLTARKRMGFMVMIFLGVFAVLMYLTKKKVWSTVPGH
jgi:ubiquinol-cytochrome c reductase cytochrome c1 subunit